MKIAAAALFLVSLVFLALTVKTVRRESRVRPKFDVARLVITLATAALLTSVMSVDTEVAVVVGVVVLGFVVGLVEGSNLTVRADATGVFARRDVVALAAWAVGITVAQVAGIAGRAGAVNFGIGMTALSGGVTLGLIVGRRGRIAKLTGARAGAGVATVGLVLILAAGGWGATTLRDNGTALAQEGAVACPGSLAGVPLASSNPRNDTETGEYSLDCRWEYTTTEDGVLYGFGFVTADVSWSRPTEFRYCPSRAGVDNTETGVDGTVSRHFVSGTHHLSANWFESTGEPFAGGEGQAAMDQLLAQVEPLAAPCLPSGAASGLACSPSVGPLVNDFASQFDTTEASEPKQWGFSCSFVVPYSDEKGQGSVTVGWTEGEIGDSTGYTPCGNPASSAGGYQHLDSAERAASVTYSVLDGAPLAAVEAEAVRLLEVAEGLAVPCPKKDGEASGAAVGTDGDEAATSEPATTSASPATTDSAPADRRGDVGEGDEVAADGDDNGVDPSSALGGTLVALLGGIAMSGAALGERGISFAEVREAWSRGGRGAVDELLSRRATSVTLTGDEARAALADGLPDVIDIPDDQQWGATVAGGGAEIRDDHIGRWGRVRGIGMVVETADGQISVTVDVDVVDAPPPEDVPDEPAASDEPAAPDQPAAPDDLPASPALSPASAVFTPGQIGDAVMDAIEDAPQTGSKVMGTVDLDGDGAAEAIAFDEDGDSNLDAIWTKSEGTVRPGDEAWPVRLSGDDTGNVVDGSGPGLAVDPGFAALDQGFADEVSARAEAGYFVRNYTGWDKLTNVPWYWHPMGGQCGEFGQWGVRWSKDFVARTYGDRAILDEIHVMERSSADPGMLEAIGESVPGQGPATLVDRWVYDTNHRSARIITPDGQRYMADYWEAMGSGDKPRLIPEREWVEHWRQKIGPDDFVVSRSEDEVYLKSLVREHGEEEGLARFLAVSKGSPNADLLARSWEVEPW